MMKFDIPNHCHIRWQAALAVLEDLQEDVDAPFNMRRYADEETIWEKTNGCGSAACFAGYISVAPYCRKLDYPKNDTDKHAAGQRAANWLSPSEMEWSPLWYELFAHNIDKGSRAKTLAYLKKTLKSIFKESTGKNLVAPLTFWI